MSECPANDAQCRLEHMEAQQEMMGQHMQMMHQMMEQMMGAMEAMPEADSGPGAQSSEDAQHQEHH